MAIIAHCVDRKRMNLRVEMVDDAEIIIGESEPGQPVQQ
jgi:hypothetical protein